MFLLCFCLGTSWEAFGLACRATAAVCPSFPQRSPCPKRQRPRQDPVCSYGLDQNEEVGDNLVAPSTEAGTVRWRDLRGGIPVTAFLAFGRNIGTDEEAKEAEPNKLEPLRFTTKRRWSAEPSFAEVSTFGLTVFPGPQFGPVPATREEVIQSIIQNLPYPHHVWDEKEGCT